MPEGTQTTDADIQYQSLLGDDDTDLTIEEKPRRRRGWIVTLVILLLLVLIAGSVITYLRANQPAAVQYQQQAVTTGNLSVTVSATGPVKANAEYDLNFSTSGQISAINVQVGQQVKAGQTLATLNATSLQDAVTAAQHKLDAANTTYTDAYNAGASQSVLDQDNASIISAQDALKAAQDNLAAATLTAPHAGTIVAINGTVGETVGSGGGSSSSSGTTQSFIVLLDTSAYLITGQVNEADIANVHVGQTAKFTVAAYPTKTFRATVSSIDTVGQTTSNVVSYAVTLTVDPQSISGVNFYPGMTATVNITTDQRIGVLLVPSAALSFPSVALQAGEINRTALRSLFSGSSTNQGAGNSGSGTNQGTGTVQGNRGIVLELKNGKLVPVVVTTGLTNGQYTEVISGLNDGDQVVVSQTGGNTSTSTSGTGGNGGFQRSGGAGGTGGLFRSGQ